MIARSRLLATLVAASAMSPPAFAGDVIPPATGGRTYVQHQINLESALHPEIGSIIVYGVRNASEGPVLFGSTADQRAVFRMTDHPAASGAVPSADGRRFVVRTPYRSRTGRPIGTIELEFAFVSGASTAPLLAVAEEVAADLSRATYSRQNAIDPYPFDPSMQTAPFAQALTRRTIAAHPELVVMMIHAVPPGSTRNVVVASNVGRIGKVADQDDLKVAEQGASNLGLNGDGDQYEVELPLLDAQKRRIGALGLVFEYALGADKQALLRRGLAIRDELAPMIASGPDLFRAAG